MDISYVPSHVTCSCEDVLQHVQYYGGALETKLLHGKARDEGVFQNVKDILLEIKVPNHQIVSIAVDGPRLS